jgi:hypothetical protein
MDLSRPYDNEIIIISNFLSENELKVLGQYQKKENVKENPGGLSSEFFEDKLIILPNHDSLIGLQETSKEYKEKLECILCVKQIQEKIKQVLDGLYPFEITLTQIRSIIRSYGAGMPVHHDDDPYKTELTTRYGFVLYLNDDYTGGEIYYPKLNIEYKPKVGDLVIHPGSEEYSHGVRDIVSGERYNITLFAHTQNESSL